VMFMASYRTVGSSENIPPPAFSNAIMYFIMLEKGIFLKPFKALQQGIISGSGNHRRPDRNSSRKGVLP
jgi:hypothetical protein